MTRHIKTLLLAMVCFLYSVGYSHPGGHHRDPATMKSWTLITGVQINGYFSHFRGSVIYIENEQHQMIKVPLSSFTAVDQQVFLKKIEAINKMNRPLQKAHAVPAVSAVSPTALAASSGGGDTTILYITILVLSALMVLLLIGFLLRSGSKYSNVESET